MNLRRTLSSHQRYYLKQICLGHIILVEDAVYEKYMVFYDGKSWPGTEVLTPPNGKVRGRAALFGNHKYSSITELLQRSILVLDGESRWLPNAEARRQFGVPPELIFPKKRVVMSRTRPARVQA